MFADLRRARPERGVRDPEMAHRGPVEVARSGGAEPPAAATHPFLQRLLVFGAVCGALGAPFVLAQSITQQPILAGALAISAGVIASWKLGRNGRVWEVAAAWIVGLLTAALVVAALSRPIPVYGTLYDGAGQHVSGQIVIFTVPGGERRQAISGKNGDFRLSDVGRGDVQVAWGAHTVGVQPTILDAWMGIRVDLREPPKPTAEPVPTIRPTPETPSPTPTAAGTSTASPQGGSSQGASDPAEPFTQADQEKLCGIRSPRLRADCTALVFANVYVVGAPRPSLPSPDCRIWYALQQLGDRPVIDPKEQTYFRIGPVQVNADGTFEGTVWTSPRELAPAGTVFRLTPICVPLSVSDDWWETLKSLPRGEDGRPPFLPLLSLAELEGDGVVFIFSTGLVIAAQPTLTLTSTVVPTSTPVPSPSPLGVADQTLPAAVPSVLAATATATLTASASPTIASPAMVTTLPTTTSAPTSTPTPTTVQTTK